MPIDSENIFLKYKKYLENINFDTNDGFELIFTNFIKQFFNLINTVDKFGINGYISVDGTYIDI